MTILFRHSATAAVALGFMLLALGSRMDEEEMEKLEKEEREALQSYIRPLGEVYERLASSDWDEQKPMVCRTESFLSLAKDKDEGVIVSTVYGPFLKRFTNDPDYEAGLGSWKWLTESAWRGHFDEPPEGDEGWASGGTVDRIADTFLPKGTLIVIWPTSDDNRVPKVTGDEAGGFEGGRFTGWSVVVDQRTGKTVCQFPLKVASSNRVEFRQGGRRLAKLFDEKPEEAIQADFEEHFEDALEAGLPKKVLVGTSLGGLF